MPQPEILKPLQKDQKTGPFLIRQATEFRQILPPAPANLEGRRRAHDLEKSVLIGQGQIKSVLLNVFFYGPVPPGNNGPPTNPTDASDISRESYLPKLICALP
jgi:hypothetical protein